MPLANLIDLPAFNNWASDNAPLLIVIAVVVLGGAYIFANRNRIFGKNRKPR